MLALLRNWTRAGVSWIENEELSRDVGFEVVVAHEPENLPVENSLDHGDRFVAQDQLVPLTHSGDPVEVAVLDEDPLAFGQRLVKHHEYVIATDGRAGLGRAAAGGLSHEAHHLARYLRRLVPVA